MPRRGRSAPTPRTTLPARTQQRAPAPVPPQPTQMAPTAAAPQQPSMFAQMAATAGGVAVGSAIGHTVGHAVTGMFSGGSSETAAAPAAVPQQAAPSQQTHGSSMDENGPCGWEVKQFLQCASTQSDLTLCQGFNEAIQQCKIRYNIA
ncbi:hypothetical protein WA026_000308 [Henosepilachna vigintioctopunctata]|uniref:Uncharacterized protein n=1 Tax=Henosepilachna vigintioctopunctata TaxID=420089 RepID=A0AAW1V4J1_9CUCU